MIKAFSSEVGPGSRQENASMQKGLQDHSQAATRCPFMI